VLDRGAEETLHEQVERQLREAIQAGRLAPGAFLPSSRGLAVELGVTRGVVSEAYGQLAAQGYLSMRQGAPVRVAASVQRQRPREPARSLFPHFAYDLRPGPDLTSFPRDAWLRSLRAAWRAAPFDALGEPDPRGVPALREALASYLARTRGAAADPEHVVVVPGFRAGFSALCRWLREQGAEAVAVEDPGWHPQRLVIEQAGLRVVPIGVDEQGLRVDALGDAPLVVVTPAQQFPTGVPLSAERRAALVEWATDGDRLIVEDDYDGERGALQGLAPERVVQIGSLAKRLAPGLRLGWMLTPSWLTWALTPALAIEAGGGDVVAQLALRDFLERGELDRHLRRMRTRRHARLAVLLEAVAAQLPDWRVGEAGERFVLASVPDEAAVIAHAVARGVGLEGLEAHRYEPGGEGGVVLGFGALPEPALVRAIELIAEISRRTSRCCRVP
jgi:GntR family transcriptional regulator/MocR family aminotransferase